ncbi:DUF1553 domain-containing protein [Chryseolinea sp. T2]|uniref:DUF1553 domain-containing protein n=1 Tax=Chryseolinea sp. T2 TaxID=3129255 RepID=UPI00307755CF
MHRIFFAMFIFTVLSACSVSLPDDVAEAYQALPEDLDYNLHVKPVLSDKCFVCHGPDKAKQKAGLRLDIRDNAIGELDESPGKFAIDPGNTQGSELVHRILSDDPDYLMPSPESHLTLSAREKAILVKWIDQGAEYKPHWAFVKPTLPKVPKTQYESKVINEIDRFIFHRLETEGLTPSNEANRELLLRRVSLDLTGLPPTLEEIGNFLNDKSADAYEKQVDRLLNSEQFGEKMAVDWLDLARFADSHGYTVDRLRDMSPYRDWVIQAFNKNYPYNKFIQWQLAGDMMPNPTKEMKLATAFNRNHAQNMEGGIIDEEFQTEYVVDRTNTFGEAFMGLSVGCARCHDHKYDPISQKNYYELFSFFNNVPEAGQISWDDAMPGPTLLLPTERQEKIIAFLSKEVDEKESKLHESERQADAAFETWYQSNPLHRMSDGKLPNSGLVGYYTFDNGSLRNAMDTRQSGVVRLGSGPESPVFESRGNGKALHLNGDAWLDLSPVGLFRKGDAFSIGLFVYIPKELKEGVIFHKSTMERHFNYRGYDLYLKDNKLRLSMSHVAPANAIRKYTIENIPRDTWVHLMMTYDGSSRAMGLRLYQNGVEAPMETVADNLTKDILLYQGQPGLQIGAWDRGWGIKDARVDDITVYNREVTPLEVRIIAGKESWSETASKIMRNDSKLFEELKVYYRSAVNKEVAASLQELRAVRNARADSVESIKEVMIMEEMARPRKSHVLLRGNYDAFGEEVVGNTPASILPFPGDLPKNRLGLSEWLIRDDHPLTARVAVNRFWQNYFGAGIVKTMEDFGNQGELPSHAELLDWLAITFRDSGWDVKKLQKLIVMSATYRRDSRASQESRTKDPENRLLSHGPANRLSAEMMRDNALAACGLLKKEIGGKSVKPYQPEGLWEINNTRYVPDTGQALYRRSLYVIVKRTVPHPTMATFDAPSRSYCVVRRQKTNTPLQSLVTLNDPTFVEAARVLGEQMTTDSNAREGVVNAYRRLTGRTPDSKEVDLLLELQQVEYKKFRDHPEKAKGWLTTGQYSVDRKLDTSLVAANTVVASAIMNSDATLTKR